MAPVRALFISAALNVGGAERQWAGLIPLLRERGVEPTVLTLLGRGVLFDELVAGGEDISCAGIRNRLDLARIRRVVTAERRVDVVVSQSFAGQVIGQLVARRAGVPHVTTEHLGSGLRRRPHERAALHGLAPMIDLTIAVASAQIPALVSAGYRRSTIRVIPNGVADLVPERTAAAVRAELGLDENMFVAVLAARLQPLKQAHHFVEAVVLAHAENERIHGVVVGSGPELSRVDALARQSGEIVRTVGERTDVVDLLGMADAVCLTSKAEALPMVVLEAMALERPVVATAVGGVPEVLDDGGAGVLVPPGRPDELAAILVRISADPSWAAELGRAARRRWAERYSADRMADGYAEVLTSMSSNGLRSEDRRARTLDAAREAPGT
jgi:glycosyltransferase involved in cell wall biosynthesis